MGITVISQNTTERQQETIELFQKCKPYLDKGETLSNAVQKVLQRHHNRFYNQAWYKELREYAYSQGYTGKR